jgi:asparagine synthase (glutamine-hydrolysing)
MCGIAGIFNLNGSPVSPVILRGMADAIAHRGPDSEGFFIDSFVGLAHRRLAVIDLSASAHQPMVSKDGQTVISYNGEIYNFQELRLELEEKGYQFHSKTDSEVVLYAYAEWKEKCVNRFNGMFAFAVWDKRAQELFLARDRYGMKPLYYWHSDKAFLFASESKAFLKFPEFKKVLDKEALLEYFTFQNIFTDRTLFSGVKILPAGCWMKLKLGEYPSGAKPVQYWDFDFHEPSKELTEGEYLEELDRLFAQAVSRQLISDVEIGAYLSGGMDSGSLTAIAATQLPYIKTFTCGFDLSSASGLEIGFDEREKAEHMSYLFKTEHYEMVLKAGDMERILPELVWHLEEPRVGQSYPNYYVARLASKFVKVVLSGAGGDELFGGYPWRYFRAGGKDFEGYIDNYYQFWQRLVPNRVIKELFSPVWKEVESVRTRDIFRDVFRSRNVDLNRPEDFINHSLYFEAKTFLHGLLVMEDKLSMAHSLETRVPFLDNDLVDFAVKLPVRLKLKSIMGAGIVDENEIKKQTKKTNDGKMILRRMMSKYIPDNITNGVKQGFSAPDAAWFKGESIDYIRKTLYKDNARIYEFLDKKSVLTLVDDHMSGKQNKRLFIWSLLNFEELCKNYF